MKNVNSVKNKSSLNNIQKIKEDVKSNQNDQNLLKKPSKFNTTNDLQNVISANAKQTITKITIKRNVAEKEKATVNTTRKKSSKGNLSCMSNLCNMSNMSNLSKNEIEIKNGSKADNKISKRNVSTKSTKSLMSIKSFNSINTNQTTRSSTSQNKDIVKQGEKNLNVTNNYIIRLISYLLFTY